MNVQLRHWVLETTVSDFYIAGVRHEGPSRSIHGQNILYFDTTLSAIGPMHRKFGQHITMRHDRATTPAVLPQSISAVIWRPLWARKHILLRLITSLHLTEPLDKLCHSASSITQSSTERSPRCLNKVICQTGHEQYWCWKLWVLWNIIWNPRYRLIV